MLAWMRARNNTNGNNHDESTPKEMEESVSSEEQEPVVVAAKAPNTTTTEQEQPAPDKKILDPVDMEVVKDDDEKKANSTPKDPSADMEEGRATASVAGAQSPTASSTVSTTTSPNELPAASSKQVEEHVEDSTETDLISSPYNFLDKICCGSPTNTTSTTTMAYSLKK
jgi:outer membrane biosynthesis protein TonB